jgi:hypothetical protein
VLLSAHHPQAVFSISEHCVIDEQSQALWSQIQLEQLTGGLGPAALPT